MDGSGTTISNSSAFRQLALPSTHGRRRGFATAQLIAGLAIIAAIAVLMQMQSGAIDPPGFLLPKAPREKKESSASPQFFAHESVDPAAPAAPADLASAIAREENFNSSLRESWQALGHMEPAAAAAMLAETEPDKALFLLSCLRERELSPILEQASPAQSAKWLSQLAALPLRSTASVDEARERGIALPLDPLSQRLQHFRIGLGLEEAPPEELSSGDPAAPELSADSAGNAAPEAEAAGGAIDGEAAPADGGETPAGTDQASAGAEPAEESIT